MNECVPWVRDKLRGLSKESVETVTLCGCSVLSGLLVQAVWVSVLIKDGILGASQAGFLASGEQLFSAIGTLSVAVWGTRLSARRVFIVSACAFAAANLIAVVPTLLAIIPGRLVSGAALGSMTAAQMRVAAKRPNAARTFALMAGSMIFLGNSYVFGAVPSLVAHFRVSGLFGVLGLAGIAMAGLSAIGMRDGVDLSDPNRSKPRLSLAPFLACSVLLTVATGVVAFGTYVVVIGDQHGFALPAMARGLGIAGFLSVLGPALAHRLGERAGLFRPLMVALTIVAIVPFLVVSTHSLVLYVVANVLLDAAMMFYWPYVMAFVGALDTTGRYVATAPVFLAIGNTVGPALGGIVIDGFSTFTLALVTTGWVAAGMLLVIAANRVAGNTTPPAPLQPKKGVSAH